MTYASEVLADSPAVFYECEEVAGTNVADGSGNGQDGTLSGAADAYEVPVAPECGNGFTVGNPSSFDEYIDVPSVAFSPGSGDFTVEMLIRSDSTFASGGSLWYLSETSFPTSTIGFIAGVVATGDVPRVGFGFLGANFFLQEWPLDFLPHLVQWTYTTAAGGTLFVTIDGVDGPAETGVNTFSFGPTDVCIFAGSSGAPGWSGDVDCLALYDHDLTFDRRLAHFTATGLAVVIPPGPPAATGTPGYRWQVLVRNHDLSIAGELEVIDLELHDKHQDISTWAVDFNGLREDHTLTIPAAALLERGAGLVFDLNGRTILSGPWTKPVRTRTGDQRTFAVGGIDDKQILADRVAHPQPGATQPPYVQVQDVRGPGAAETIIKAFVNANCGPGAVVNRRARGLSIEPDLVRGAIVKGIGDWTKQLDVLVQSLAQAGGVGYRIIQTDAPALQFRIYLPFDKTATVVFGVELGNTSGYSYSLQRPAGNYIYGLGAGTGILRTIREGQNEASIGAYGRIEAVSDQSSTSDLTLLNQAIATELASKAEQFSATVTALDTHAHQWAPVAADPVAAYDLGDRVTIVIEGVELQETITEIVATFNSDRGTTITPVIGTPMYGSQIQWLLGALTQKIKDQERQLRVRQGV